MKAAILSATTRLPLFNQPFFLFFIFQTWEIQRGHVVFVIDQFCSAFKGSQKVWVDVAWTTTRNQHTCGCFILGCFDGCFRIIYNWSARHLRGRPHSAISGRTRDILELQAFWACHARMTKFYGFGCLISTFQFRFWVVVERNGVFLDGAFLPRFQIELYRLFAFFLSFGGFLNHIGSFQQGINVVNLTHYY